MFNSYSDMVAALAKPGCDVIKDLTPESAHLWHMGTGASGEAGELLDAVKKHAIYGRQLDRDNVIEELGDLEFYMEGIRAQISVTREEVLERNKKKLWERYGDKYSNKSAVERLDKVGGE